MKVWMAISVLLFGFFSSTASVAVNKGVVDSSKITHGVIAVAAVNDEWTATSIKVLPGDILLTVEQGNQVVVGSYLGAVDANGTKGVGVLQLKIGTGAARTIGAQGFVVVNEAGVVKLKIYDTAYQDNSGEFRVSIIRIPGALVPEGEDVAVE